MGAPKQHRRKWFQRLKARWSEAREACRSIDPGNLITLVPIAIWLACVPMAAWMAAGEPPWWLTYPAVVLLWAIGAFYFLILGLPPLTLPFALILFAFPWIRAKADGWLKPADEWERQYEGRAKQTKELKDSGVLPEDFELPPRRADEFPDFQRRTMSDPPFLSVLRPVVIAAVVVLIVALFADGRPYLGALYVIMAVGWPVAEGLHWLLLRWRGAPDGR